MKSFPIKRNKHIIQYVDVYKVIKTYLISFSVFRENMFNIIKFVYVKFSILSLILCVMFVDWHKFGDRFPYNWAKLCSLHSECPYDMCKTPFKAACIDKVCKCRFYKIEN